MGLPSDAGNPTTIWQAEIPADSGEIVTEISYLGPARVEWGLVATGVDAGTIEIYVEGALTQTPLLPGDGHAVMTLDAGVAKGGAVWWLYNCDGPVQIRIQAVGTDVDVAGYLTISPVEVR
jgi:hypothetical protein